MILGTLDSSSREESPVKRALDRLLGLTAFGLLLLSAAMPRTASAEMPDKTAVSRTAEIDGVRFHYLTAGHGAPVILLHGYAETSLMWRPIIPLLAKRFTVIAPDLPGIGDSSIPPNGLDMKTAATRVHAFARSLGIERARVVGHDIGLMVAYAYAAQFPAEVEKLVLMDAFLPGVGEWEAVYNNPGFWHFRFNGPTPEALVKGRERTYFEHFWNDFAADKARSIPEADRKTYTAAYSRPGRMRAGWAYFVSFPQAAKDFAELSQTKLPMPLLVIGGRTLDTGCWRNGPRKRPTPWRRFSEQSQAAGRDGARRTGTPLRIDWPMIGSTTESSTQSLMDTPAWLPATFCHGALSAWPQPCGRLTTPGRISSVTATRTSPRWTRLSRTAISPSRIS